MAKYFLRTTPWSPQETVGLRYGDGLFETMRVVNGRIVLQYLHFDRLFQGISILQFHCPPLFTPHTCQKRSWLFAIKWPSNRLPG